MPTKSFAWDAKIFDVPFKMSKDDVLRLLRCYMDDRDIADVIIETLDTNKDVCEIVEKWIKEE